MSNTLNDGVQVSESSVISYMDVILQPAICVGYLLVLRLDGAEHLRLVARQLVQGRLADVDRLRLVDPGERDVARPVREAPARPALGRVPRRDGGRAADVGERRERSDGLVALGGKPVRAVRARKAARRELRVIVHVVVRDGEGGCEGNANGGEGGGEEGKDTHG